MSDLQASIQALFFARGEFGLGGAALFAMFNKRRQGRVGVCSMHSQRVLGCDGTKRHAHDGVRAGREDMHFAVLYQGA